MVAGAAAVSMGAAEAGFTGVAAEVVLVRAVGAEDTVADTQRLRQVMEPRDLFHLRECAQAAHIPLAPEAISPAPEVTTPGLAEITRAEISGPEVRPRQR